MITKRNKTKQNKTSLNAATLLLQNLSLNIYPHTPTYNAICRSKHPHSFIHTLSPTSEEEEEEEFVFPKR